jgi:hypothetical protein
MDGNFAAMDENFGPLDGNFGSMDETKPMFPASMDNTLTGHA